jgi:hypothetical protein
MKKHEVMMHSWIKVDQKLYELVSWVYDNGFEEGNKSNDKIERIETELSFYKTLHRQEEEKRIKLFDQVLILEKIAMAAGVLGVLIGFFIAYFIKV